MKVQISKYLHIVQQINVRMSRPKLAKTDRQRIVYDLISNQARTLFNYGDWL